jgi:hypothetical protein
MCQAEHAPPPYRIARSYGPVRERSVRTAGDGDDPDASVDLTLDDEFPLSIFFSSLRAAMAEEGLARARV